MRCVAASLALLIGLAFTSGCRKEDGPTIQVDPKSFDFGVVAANGQEINAVINVQNNGATEAKVKLRPTCGCISSIDKLSLKPGESREVPFTFSTTGKTGNFHAKIGFDCDGHVQSVPVDIIFEPEVHVFPSRVVLLPGENDKLTGEFSLEATESLMPSLLLDVDDDEVELKKIEREDGDLPDPVQVRYRVVASDASKRIFPPIRVRKKGQESPVLSIPIISVTPYSD